MISINEINLLQAQNEKLLEQNKHLQKENRQLKDKLSKAKKLLKN